MFLAQNPLITVLTYPLYAKLTFSNTGLQCYFPTP